MSESQEFSQRIMPHSRKMFAVAYRYLQRADEAEDAVQDVLTRLWQMRDHLPPDKELPPYVLTMTRNLCIDRIRSRQTLTEDSVWVGMEQAATDDGASANEDGVEQKDRLRQLIRLIKQLPSDQQHVIRLKAMDDLSNEQIARITGWQPDNIRQLLSRARRRLKEMAQKQGLI